MKDQLQDQNQLLECLIQKKKEMEREAGINLSEYGLEPDGLPPIGKNLK